MTDAAATASRSDVTVERAIEASPERIYELVSDLRRMGEWSPESKGGRWRSGATKAVVGAKFRGHNRIGWRRWSTTCTITEARPGQALAFDVSVGPLAVASWQFELAPIAGERRLTNVIQRYHDRRGRLMRAIGRLATGVADRTDHNRKTMTQTLLTLGTIAEADNATEPTDR